MADNQMKHPDLFLFGLIENRINKINDLDELKKLILENLKKGIADDTKKECGQKLIYFVHNFLPADKNYISIYILGMAEYEIFNPLKKSKNDPRRN